LGLKRKAGSGSTEGSRGKAVAEYSNIKLSKNSNIVCIIRVPYALYRLALFSVTSGDLWRPQATLFPSQADTVRKRLNRSSSFWHRGFPLLILDCVGKEFGYLQK